jgi:single-stranded DNA-binding protein
VSKKILLNNLAAKTAQEEKIMLNHSNFGIMAGRLTQDVTVFNNKDGSRKVFVKLAVPRNYKAKDGTIPTDFIQAEGFIQAGQKGNGPFDYMHKGDKVSLEVEMRSSEYEKNGEKVYAQAPFIRSVQLLESKKTTDARMAARAAGATGATATAPADAAPAYDTEPANQ